MKTLILLCLVLNGCTIASYKDSERRLFVADLHPGGEAVAIAGKLEQLGELTIDRQTADATQVLATAAQAAVAISLP